ncbi:MAG: DUF4954 family protein [Breznakibacter sp.]
MLYRHLTENEISELIHNRCHAENWNLIKVKEGFDTTQVSGTYFSGQIQLGTFEPGTGVRNVQLSNCTVEDNALINQVGLIENYIIRSHARILFCGTIKADGLSYFGNGTKLNCVNEAGGREVTIYNGLNAQVAYLMAFSRHCPTIIENIERLINAEVELSRPEKGVIGHYAKLVSCTTVCNVVVGDHAVIEGALHLNNGTILSTVDTPTYVGHGTMAYDFIAAHGSRIDNGSIIKRCFVGESSVVDRQFSAENTLIFSNCQLYHGEACSVFAAPYTVSHHKSTLLVATYCSFINVGSGSNQSNHMYKLGPVHQGILERGCKLGSDSYILWPGKIGPFTFISGRHYSNPDLSDFPFSYLLDDDGVSQLVPGANLRSVGTLRDANKWPNRDERKSIKSNLIHFDLFNPYCTMLAYYGKTRLKKLEESTQNDMLNYNLGDVKIKKPALKRGIDIYEDAITLFVGSLIVDHIISGNPLSVNVTESQLTFEWVDLAGLFVNKSQLDELLEQIRNNDVVSISKLNKALLRWHLDYKTASTDWAIAYSKQLTGMDLFVATKEEIADFIDKWALTSIRFYQMLGKDAQKEFSERSKTGYGIFNEGQVRHADFSTVRGTYESNSFVQHTLFKMTEIKETAEKAKKMLPHLKYSSTEKNN